MNLYPHIKLSDNLIENQESIITYSGFLFEKNSESVTIVYGFGNNWNNTTELEMQKFENGFSAKIKALEYSNCNFCFRNSNYEWDNNNNQNYTVPISKPKLEDAFIINEDIIDNILDNIKKYDISKIIDTKVLPNNNVNEISENNGIEDFEIAIENNESINLEESKVNITEEKVLNDNINQIFEEIYVEKDNNTDNNIENTFDANDDNNSNKIEEHDIKENNNSQSIQNNLNIDSLVDEILAPVKESTTFNEETFIINELSENSNEEIFEEVNELENDEKVNNLIDGLITDLYKNVNSSIEKSNTENLFVEGNDQTVNKTSLENNNADSLEKNNNDSIENLDNIIEEVNINNALLDELSDKINNIFEEPNSNNDFIENSTIENVELDIDNMNTDDFENNIQEKIQDAIENNIINEFMENSNNEITDNSKALIETDNCNEFMISPRKLSKAYKFKKKIRLAFYKLLALPKTLFSNFGESKN